jgi:GxxExxY protein
MEERLRHEDVTRRVIACAMTVHSRLGSGFQEVIYQRAMAIEMPYQGLSFEREKEMEIFYRNILIGTRRVDFFIETVIMLELKATSQLDDSHIAQGLNYLEAYNLEIGLLVNFGAKSLEWKRLLNKKYKPAMNHG